MDPARLLVSSLKDFPVLRPVVPGKEGIFVVNNSVQKTWKVMSARVWNAWR